MTLVLRPYQQACIERALAANTIVALPTGKGKTLVAAHVVDHFFRKDADRHICFIVPTRALVGQQADYCESHCASKPPVARLSGMEMEGWDEVKWNACLGKSRVLVGTPEVFRRAMEQAFLRPAQFSLLVFDECHHAKGNAPMAAVMRDFVGKLEEEKCPRILGLTASFFAGALKRKRDAEQARIDIELLLKASVFSPEVGLEGAGPDGCAHDEGASRAWERVPWQGGSEQTTDFSGVQAALETAFKALGDAANQKHLRKMAARMQHVFEQLGSSSLTVYVEKCVVRQLARQLEDLESVQQLPPEDRARVEDLLGKLPLLRDIMEGLAKELPRMPCLANAPVLSSKVLALHELLKRDALAKGKGIVFVEQIAVTVPLADTIKRHVGRAAEAIYGPMPKQDMDRCLEHFRGRQIEILVSTTALEEGIDVCDCDWVVRFDRFSTTRNHIQGSGRARSSAARIYYFDNDPGEEQSKALIMSRIAKDSGLALSDSERRRLEEQHRPDLAAAKGVYPFEAPGGQPIHLFNCLEVVYAWCQQVLGQDFDAEVLYQYEDGQLCAVRVPTSSGYRSVTMDDVSKYWGAITLQAVVEKERLKPLTKVEQSRRRALFVVAVQLRRDGMLDGRNQPQTKQLRLAQASCPVDAPKKMKLTMGGSFGRGDPVVKGGNYKTALQEMLQQWYRSLPVNEILSYDCVMGDDGWKATLRVLPKERAFVSDAFPSKKGAEHDAAKKAFGELRSSP